jgi:hypothetical protein
MTELAAAGRGSAAVRSFLSVVLGILKRGCGLEEAPAGEETGVLGRGPTVPDRPSRSHSLSTRERERGTVTLVADGP